MKSIFSPKICDSSIIIATKGNKLEKDELEDRLDSLVDLANKYNI